MGQSTRIVGYASGIVIFLSLQISALQWTSCGNSSDLAQLSKLTVVPEILKLPGMITVNAKAELRENVTDKIKVELEVKKKMFWGDYVRIPCEDGIGSCTYDDICTLSPFTSECPVLFQKNNIPCKCPIKQGVYAVKDISLQIKRGHLPKFLVSGKYKIHVIISSKGKQIGCYDAQITFK